MSHFSLLADPAGYSVSDVNVLADDESRAYWVKLFQEHFEKALISAATAYGRTHARQIEAAREQFTKALDPLRENPPGGDAPLGVVQLCRMREKALRDNGLHDPYRHIKQRENDLAIEQYPQLIRYLTSLPAEERWQRLVRGVFAGNIFDLGSPATMGFADENVDFEATVEKIKPRPWLIDDFDELMDMLPLAAGEPSPWAKAVIFVDNAGADFVLGVMPLARQLAGHATTVVLAANELPSLNDVTADETVRLMEALGDIDSELAGYAQAGMFEVVSTGNGIPLIDLSDVSDELNAAAEDADLVILEGMGRSVESNLHTVFDVDAIQLCLLKDPHVAGRVNGEVFDCVCKFEPVEVEVEEEAADEA